MQRNIVFVLLVILISCQGGEETENRIKIDLDESINGKFSEVFESIEYIILENPDESPLVWPYTLKYHTGNFWLRDITTNKIFKFSEEGNLKSVFKPLGKGPLEYFQVDDFQVFQDSIVLKDSYLKKFISFDHFGTPIKEHRFPLNSLHFHKGPGYTLHFLGYTSRNEGYLFQRISESTNDQFGVFPTDGSKEKLGIMEDPQGFLPLPDSDKLIYKLPLTREIAIFDGVNGSPISILEFDYGTYNLPEELIGQRIDKNQEPNSYVQANGAFLPLKNKFFLFVKQGQENSHYIFLDHSFSLLAQYQNLENDIDGLQIKSFPWASNEHEIFYLIRSLTFYNSYVETFANQKVKILPNTVHEFFQLNKAKLVDDNWIIIRLKLKD
ncbi:6-bladed beta-propeller [Aquiflexum sp. TKW24L]|uniref:6-bladed beta-propeller n=1 Tax=Aquiflexum sp. TKW24L TaxID=2942212 RepID=UPI0020C02EE8|nr:6-bladed beta-propeller [Aquiflexum sp. TKW24L]MCL6260880.1 6-bladed beta-propeller [Aquiflexum sp. TKW24L]